MVAAYTIGLLIDSQMNGTVFDHKWIWLSFVLIALLVLLRFLFDYLRAKYQETISYELVARDRLAIGEALKRVSLGYFQQVNTGNILNSITTGLHTLENMGMRMVDDFVGGYLNFLCVFLFLLFVNPVVSLIALGGTALSFCFLLLVSRYSKQNAPVSAKATEDLTAATLEYVRGLPVVKSFGQGGASIAAMRTACKDSKDIHMKIEWGYIPSNCLHLLALKLASVGLAAASCYLGMTGEMSFYMMLMFVFFSFSIFASLEPISDSAHILGVIDNAMDQLEALKVSNFIDRDGKDVPLNHHDIEFKNVDFGYDERTILHDVSFRIPEKTMTAIVGPSGSGKSTLMNIIGCLDVADAGSYRLDDLPIEAYSENELAKIRNEKIGFVFQSFNLIPKLSAEENVELPLIYQKVPRAERVQRVKEALERVGLANRAKHLPTELSGGQQQRVAIARAIVTRPKLILADEPTGALDSKTSQEIIDIFHELHRQGNTIVLITHDGDVAKQAERSIHILDGQITEVTL